MKPENDNRDADNLNIDGLVAIVLAIAGAGCVLGTIFWLAFGDHSP